MNNEKNKICGYCKILQRRGWYLKCKRHSKPDAKFTQETYYSKEYVEKEAKKAAEDERKRCINIVLKCTEIPRGAKNPTRDAIVILGEHIVNLLDTKEGRINK